MCFHLETVAADGLVTGPRIKAMMQAGSRGHQQAAHFGAVTLKHTDAFMSLQQEKRQKKKFVRLFNSQKNENQQQKLFVDAHHQVEGFDSPVSWAGVQQPVVDLHGVHCLLVALEHTLGGQIVLTVVRWCICETKYTKIPIWAYK